MGKQKLVAAIDYGSDSARMILADAGTGITLSEQAMAYPRWANRKFCDGSVQQWRQHPLDYLEVLGTFQTVIIRRRTGARNCRYRI